MNCARVSNGCARRAWVKTSFDANRIEGKKKVKLHINRHVINSYSGSESKVTAAPKSGERPMKLHEINSSQLKRNSQQRFYD